MAPSRLPNTCLAEKFTGCNNALTCGFTCHRLPESSPRAAGIMSRSVYHRGIAARSPQSLLQLQFALG